MALIDDTGRRWVAAPPRRQTAKAPKPEKTSAPKKLPAPNPRGRVWRRPEPVRSPATASAPTKPVIPAAAPTVKRASSAEDLFARPGFNARSPLTPAPVQGPTRAEAEAATRKHSKPPEATGPLSSNPDSPLNALSKTSDVQRQYLTKSGYNLPQGPLAKPKSPYDTNGSKRQTAHSYSLSDLEKEISNDIAQEIGWTQARTLPTPNPRGVMGLNPPGGQGAQGPKGPGGRGLPQAPNDEEKAAREAEAEKNGVNPEDVTVQATTSHMSWEDYEKLSRPQKLALAFNADLVAARNKDLKSKKKREDYTQEQQDRYDQSVEKVFGEEGGSDTYAPNTMALLEQVDLKGVGQDLDEYLSLERAFTADMVKGMKKLSKDLPMELAESGLSKETYAQVRTPTNTQLVNTSIVRNYRNKINDVMSNAETVRATVEDAMGVARNESLTAMGADAYVTGAQTGFPLLTPEATARIENNESYTQQEGETYMFQRSYEFLMNPENTNLDELWANIEYNEMDDRDVAKLWDYFNTRSKQEEKYGRPEALGTGGRTPQEIRQFAGIGD